MPFFGSSPQEDSQLELPATKRISTPASQRLTTITEGGNPKVQGPPTPPIPRRSSRRNSGAAHSFGNSKRWSGSTETTLRSAPPPYGWVPDPIAGSSTSLQGPNDDEKLARLRRGENVKATRRRGGWMRLGLIIAVALLVIIALAVGLGVGLTRKKSGSGSGQQQPSPNQNPPQKFPLGKYSMITALESIDYGCTSNQATWRCWPYVVYSPSTNTSSLAAFNWILSNTADDYATISSAATPDEGIPANITVSSTDNPFGITFSDKPMTYISSSTNTSSARLTFSFSMIKTVVPSQAITADNSNSKCFFNETTFTGTLYLSSPRSYPSVDQQGSSLLGGYEQWPHAVEITQVANGGANVPNCYETNNGTPGQRITNNLSPMPNTDQCICDYRNY